MIRMALTPRDRRALIAGAATIGILGIVGRVVPAWRAWQRASLAETEHVELDAGRAAGLVRMRRALHDSLVARRHRLDSLASASFGGDSPAAGGASLAAVVTDAAGRAGVTIGAIDISADSMGAGPLVRVRVRANASGDIAGIASLLAELERTPARLVVRALSIQGSDVGAGADRAEVLQADLLVEGVWRKPAWMARE